MSEPTRLRMNAYTVGSRVRAQREAKAETERADAAEQRAREAEALLATLTIGRCPECGPVTRCDVEGCCLGCGADIVLAARAADQGRRKP